MQHIYCLRLGLIFSIVILRCAWQTAGLTYPIGTCRLETRQYLPEEDFNRVACARCYNYMHPVSFINGSRLKFCGVRLCNGECGDNISECYEHAGNLSNARLVFETFQTDRFAEKWESCCEAAQQCCQRQKLNQRLRHPNITFPGMIHQPENYCPATWDGWTCYDDTPSATTTFEKCPIYAYPLTDKPECIRTSRKICDVNGTWALHPVTGGREHTFYNDCGHRESHRTKIYLSVSLHALSVVLLVPAIIIFSIYKQLKVYRISLHKNVCIALTFHSLSAILMDAIFTLDALEGQSNTTIAQHQWACRALNVSIKYFRLCQYSWMFCEAYYLHKLIVAAFREQKSMLLFYFLGWVCPTAFVTMYAVLVYTTNSDGTARHRCGIDAGQNYEWFLLAPGLTCLVLNFVFLANIIRVLVSKLRSQHANEPSQFRKAVRAVLVLFPLFGMHFLLVLYRAPSQCGAWTIYQYISVASDGLQGFFVALIFCYLNGEIQTQLFRSAERIKVHTILSRSQEWRRSTLIQHHHFNRSPPEQNKIEEQRIPLKVSVNI